MRLVATGRHTIVQPSLAQLEKLVGETLWEQYREVLVRGGKTALDVTVFASPHDCAACDPVQLADFLELKTIVLIENPRSDGGFLSAVARALRPRLQRHLEEKTDAVDLRHGAGITQIPEEIRRLAPRYVRLQIAGLPARFVVVADSDAPLPDRPSLEARRVRDAADECGVPSHLLSKRSIENYMPDEALVAYVGVRRDRVEPAAQIMALTPAGRDHYPMKNGFDSIDALTPDERALYPADLAPGVKLGDFVGDLLDVARDALTLRGFRSRDEAGELDQLLDLLEENI